MFSQGRGAGLFPGTSAHNPTAFSEQAKETERGRGGRGKTGKTFLLKSGVNDESDDIEGKQIKSAYTRILPLYAKLMKNDVCV